MKNDITARERERESYKDSKPCCGPGEICGSGHDWNNPFDRRAFLKGLGGATAGTVLALNGMKIEVLAGDSASVCREMPVGVSVTCESDLSFFGEGQTRALAEQQAWDNVLHFILEDGGSILRATADLCEPITWNGAVILNVGSINVDTRKTHETPDLWRCDITLDEGTDFYVAMFDGNWCGSSTEGGGWIPLFPSNNYA